MIFCVYCCTLWRLRPAIYGAAQNYIASETSIQSRITNTTRKQLKKIGYRPRTMIRFWNVRTVLEEGAQTHQNSRLQTNSAYFEGDKIDVQE